MQAIPKSFLIKKHLWQRCRPILSSPREQQSKTRLGANRSVSSLSWYCLPCEKCHWPSIPGCVLRAGLFRKEYLEILRQEALQKSEAPCYPDRGHRAFSLSFFCQFDLIHTDMLLSFNLPVLPTYQVITRCLDIKLESIS